MRKCDFVSNHAEFCTWIEWYGDFLARLVAARRVIRNKFEKLELIEAFVLRTAVRWEVLLSADIVASLNRDASRYAEALGLRLRKHLTRDECKAMLFGQRYIDFRNVDDARAFGKKYLVDRFNPFPAIAASDGKRIDEFLVIRNLLAHYSDFARRPYERIMRDVYSYTRIPEPGAFLMAQTQKHEYRWSVYLRAFLQAATDMTARVKV